ncbi:MAG: 4-hydroxy-tetrahydrodipicolinate reductase [Actinobacteria bacterium]|nr:MAG: 4-hydroxy-tetrahydrodipicolinate reductase [Actinomycetota bacterium]
MIKVAVFGAAGKMGSEVVKAITTDSELELVASVDINDNANEALKKVDVAVDFTHPSVVMENINRAIGAGVHYVVGTTGITQENLDSIKQSLEGKEVGVFIAPNFAIGAVLMMELSKKAAAYLSDLEIIELHHNQKIDAPSGTSLKTATELKKIVGNDIPIHSVRLPGLVAHQEVIFGGLGQTLTIRHDSIDRNSFMPGVVMAIKAVSNKKGLTYGLENILDI